MSAADGHPDGRDADEPIEALSRLEAHVSPTLVRRVRAAVQRRMLAAQLVELSSLGVIRTIFEYVRMMFQTISRDGRGGGGGP